ncbi:MAG: hypothetical protein JWN93_968 [Hyphomicrobiales bacterium]|nr:hypothetical protein [Hyphomicrobiales bacterium]
MTSETQAPIMARPGLYGHPTIDCDLHPPAPSNKALAPYLNSYWREMLTVRGIDRLQLNPTSYPANAPLTRRPDWAQPAPDVATQVAQLTTQALDPFGTTFAICNSLHGAQLFHGEDMAAVFCAALNDWMAREWLDRDPRLRASILIPSENPQLAVAEIERVAKDERFVSVQMLCMGEMTLGRRFYWPIYEAAHRNGLAVAVHAGSGYRHAPTSIGWPSYYIEEYVANSAAFENQLLSLIAEGALSKFPELRFVFAESGWSWLPAFMWRAGKTWRGVRAEVPWVDRTPAEFIRQHVRFTLQPVDAPPTQEMLRDVIDQLGSDRMLMFSTDYPHWQFDGLDALPRPLQGEAAPRVLYENALEAYPRLKAAFAAL